MILKGCSRCNGDVYREEDLGSYELVCLQCGHRVSTGSAVSQIYEIRAPAQPRRSRQPARAA